MVKNKSYTASAKNVVVAPKKLRPIADNIRGQSYERALGILAAMPNKGARVLLKVLKSALSNAIYFNNNLSEDLAFVKTLKIDEGRKRKRIWPRARGKADRLINRSSHIFVELAEKKQGNGE